MREVFGYDAEDMKDTDFPLSFKEIGKAQSADKKLLQNVQADNDSKYHLKNFHEGGKLRELICHNDKIVIPTKLQKRVVEWYHHYLGHPGVNRTEETIQQHL